MKFDRRMRAGKQPVAAEVKERWLRASASGDRRAIQQLFADFYAVAGDQDSDPADPARSMETPAAFSYTANEAMCKIKSSGQTPRAVASASQPAWAHGPSGRTSSWRLSCGSGCRPSMRTRRTDPCASRSVIASSVPPPRETQVALRGFPPCASARRVPPPAFSLRLTQPHVSVPSGLSFAGQLAATGEHLTGPRAHLTGPLGRTAT